MCTWFWIWNMAASLSSTSSLPSTFCSSGMDTPFLNDTCNSGNCQDSESDEDMVDKAHEDREATSLLDRLQNLTQVDINTAWWRNRGEIAKVADLDEVHNVLEWWKSNGSSLPRWLYAALKKNASFSAIICSCWESFCCLSVLKGITRKFAAADRVFSLLKYT